MDRKTLSVSISNALRRESSPRLVTALILLLSTLFGFLSSVFLLHNGLSSMAVRYPIAFISGYAAFLCLFFAYAKILSSGFRDGPHESRGAVSSGSSVHHESGLDFINPFDLPVDTPGDGPEILLVLALVAMVLFLLFFVFSIVSAAPEMLGEIVLDIMIAGGAYRYLSVHNEGDWFSTAIKHTGIPALALLSLISITGYAFQYFAPDVHSAKPATKELLSKLINPGISFLSDPNKNHPSNP